MKQILFLTNFIFCFYLFSCNTDSVFAETVEYTATFNNEGNIDDFKEKTLSFDPAINKTVYVKEVKVSAIISDIDPGNYSSVTFLIYIQSNSNDICEVIGGSTDAKGFEFTKTVSAKPNFALNPGDKVTFYIKVDTQSSTEGGTIDGTTTVILTADDTPPSTTTTSVSTTTTLETSTTTVESTTTTTDSTTTTTSASTTTTSASTTTTIPIYKISGRITDSTGAGMNGVTVTFTNPDSTSNSENNGNYSRNVYAGWSGTVTPSMKGYIFKPKNYTFSNIQSNEPNKNFTGYLLILNDAVAGMQVLVGLKPDLLLNADADQDGKVEVEDIILILQAVSGLR